MSLVSCYHIVSKPLRTPKGVLVVVMIPGARVGEEPLKSQVMAALESVSPFGKAKGEDERIAKYFPYASKTDSPGIGAILIPSEFKTKKGEKFVGGQVSVFASGYLPHEQVEKAAALGMADTYQKAKKNAQIVPVTELAERPKQGTP